MGSYFGPLGAPRLIIDDLNVDQAWYGMICLQSNDTKERAAETQQRGCIPNRGIWHVNEYFPRFVAQFGH